MSEGRNIAIGVVACILALGLQIVVAPYIALGNVVPNFVVATIIALAATGRQFPCTGFAFIMGVVYAFVCGGPVGALAALLIISVMVERVMTSALEGGSGLGVILFTLVGSLITMVGMGVALCACGLQTDMFDSVVMVGLPCAVYDWILAVLIGLALRSLMVESKPTVNLETPRFR